MKLRNIMPSASQKYVTAAPLDLHFGKKIDSDFSFKIIQNLKKSVIVKLLFNESYITVGHDFTFQLDKLEVSILKPKDATSI